MTPKLLPTPILNPFSDYSQTTPILRWLPDYSHTKPILRILPDYYNSKMTLRLLQILDDFQTAAHSKITPGLLPILRLLSDHSLYSQKTPPRFPDDSPDSPDYQDSKTIEILLFNQCTQTPCRLWQVQHYLHSSHHPLAGADGNRKDSKFTFSNSSQTHRYSYSQITARLITFWNFS